MRFEAVPPTVDADAQPVVKIRVVQDDDEVNIQGCVPAPNQPDDWRNILWFAKDGHVGRVDLHGTPLGTVLSTTKSWGGFVLVQVK